MSERKRLPTVGLPIKIVGNGFASGTAVYTADGARLYPDRIVIAVEPGKPVAAALYYDEVRLEVSVDAPTEERPVGFVALAAAALRRFLRDRGVAGG